MDGPTATARPRRPAELDTTLQPRDLVAVVVLGLLAALVGWALLRDPPRVATLTIENPTSYDLTVSARAVGTDAVVSVGPVGRGATATFQDVIDHGDEWVLDARGQGRDGGEWTLTRAQLEAADWVVVVPDSVDEALAAQGAPSTPLASSSTGSDPGGSAS